MITHLEPDILKCEVKWALGNITTNKASGGDGTQVKLFQILKDDAVKVLHSNLDNSAVATGLEKVSFHSNPKERQCQRMLKLPHNCTHLTRGSEVKVSAWNAGDQGSIPGLGRSPEEGMATHSSTLAWRIPWTEEPGGLQSMGS